MADDEGLAPFPGHEGRPRWPARPGRAELGEQGCAQRVAQKFADYPETAAAHGRPRNRSGLPDHRSLTSRPGEQIQRIGITRPGISTVLAGERINEHVDPRKVSGTDACAAMAGTTFTPAGHGRLAAFYTEGDEPR
jgi:hypothetical protein